MTFTIQLAEAGARLPAAPVPPARAALGDEAGGLQSGFQAGVGEGEASRAPVRRQASTISGASQTQPGRPWLPPYAHFLR